MPIFIHNANLIFDKQILEEKYAGGLALFYKDFDFHELELAQEDNLICALAALNADEFSIDKLIEKGLDWDQEKQDSTDFVILERYGGALWKVDWLEADSEDYPSLAWHMNTNEKIKTRAREVCNMPMDQLEAECERIDGDMVDLVRSIED